MKPAIKKVIEALKTHSQPWSPSIATLLKYYGPSVPWRKIAMPKKVCRTCVLNDEITKGE